MSIVQKSDLKMAAFEIARLAGNGVYSKEVVQALELFTKLPCPETAIILITAWPEAMLVMASASSEFALNLPKHMRGPKYAKLDEWMKSFDHNERACGAIHGFLLRGATDGSISIGFHRMRDQQILIDRLATLGIRKGIFSNRRQFLRDRITCEIRAFRSVIDLICIHGIAGGRERFWNALGAELGPQWHLQSELQYALSVSAEEFSQLADRLASASEET